MNDVPSRTEMNNERAQPGLTPKIGWLRGYRKDWLRYDVMAGLITAAVIIPKAMAYATVAGLPVQVGLYTAFLPMLIYAVLGTSRPLSVSTTTTLAILAAAYVREGNTPKALDLWAQIVQFDAAGTDASHIPKPDPFELLRPLSRSALLGAPLRSHPGAIKLAEMPFRDGYS